VQAADIASLFEKDQAFRVMPMLGDVGAGNLRLLLQRPRRRYRFRLDRRYCRRGSAGRDTDHLELVKRLAPQEVHVLARTEIGSLSELAGKKVSVGPQGSSSAATATALFKALGITVEPQHLDASTAIEWLKQGTIDAAVIVGGKPYPLVSAVPTNSGIHLLPVPFGASLEAAYLPTRIEQHDYPNLIQPGGKVPTVATGMVIARRKGRSSLGGARHAFCRSVVPAFRGTTDFGAASEVARGQPCCKPAGFQPHACRRHMAQCAHGRDRGKADCGRSWRRSARFDA